jgi:hypothetical protein
MHRLPLASLAVLLLVACSPSPQSSSPDAGHETTQSAPADARLGSEAWYDWVDRSLGISQDGHGPDHGSPEWNQAVQRKLGQEAPQASPGSPEWQQAVDALLRTRSAPP